MKRYCFYACLLGIAFMNQSCKDFLDIEPKSKGIAIANNASDSIIYKSGSEAEAALGGVYADFKNEYYQLDYFVNGEAQSDNAYAGGDNPDNFQIDEFLLNATNRNVSRDWAYLYATIGKANSVINNVPKVTDARLTAERRKEIIAEAASIRAFMYFQLVQLWGDVPLQLKDVKTISAATLPEVYPLLFPARAPATDIYKQIILDLETALQGVKAKGIDKGFISKGAVNAVLTKVYAPQEPRDWAKVKKYSDDVISGGYALLTNYDFLWDNAHENSDEAIWEINYNGGITDGNWGTMIFRGLDWKKFNLPANDLIRAFDAENDRIRKAATVVFLDVTGKWSEWDFGDGTTATTKDVTKVYTASSLYKIKMTATNPAGSASSTQESFVTTSILTDAALQGAAWKVRADDNSVVVGPGLGNNSWYTVPKNALTGVSTGVDDWSCLANDEFTFSTGGVYKYDTKGNARNDGYMNGANGCISDAELAVSGNGSAFKTATHSYVFTAAAGANRAKIVVSNGATGSAFIGFYKAYFGGENGDKAKPVNGGATSVTYQVMGYAKSATKEYMYITCDISTGKDGTAAWSFVLQR